MNTSAMTSIARIVKRNGTVVAYDRERIATAIFKATASIGPADRALAERMAERVEGALTQAYTGTMLPAWRTSRTSSNTCSSNERHTDLARDYIIYRHQRAMVRAARATSFEVTTTSRTRRSTRCCAGTWTTAARPSTGSTTSSGGGFPDLVRAAERRYAEEGAGRAGDPGPRHGSELVIVAGPSSSGKTTTTIKISERLSAAGLELKAINIDHYFFDLDQHPRDEFGDYDYETPQALDLELINQHLAELLAGKTIKTPHYDFKTGNRHARRPRDAAGEERDPADRQPARPLRRHDPRACPAEHKFKLYIETLGQFRDGGRHVHALGGQPAAAPHDPRQRAPQPPADADADPLALRAPQRAASTSSRSSGARISSSTAPCPTSCRS